LLIPLAQAQQLPPDVLVKSITEEVVAILKKDKDIQAGRFEKGGRFDRDQDRPAFSTSSA